MADGNGNVWAAVGAAFLTLPSWAQVGAVVLAIGGGAVGAYTVTEEIRELPDRVAELEERFADDRELDMQMAHQISILSLRIEDLSERVDLVVCLQEAASGYHGYEQCARSE
jgi:hypothetical protein